MNDAHPSAVRARSAADAGGTRSSSPRARPRRRICIVTSEQLATNPRVVKEADALSAAGHDVRVVSCLWMDWPRRAESRLRETRTWRSQVVDFSRALSPVRFWHSRLRFNLARRLPASWWRSEFVLARALGRMVPEMIRVAASEPADLFIGHNLAGLPAAVLAARQCRAAAAFDAEDFHSGMWLTERGPALTDRLARLAEERFLPECRYVTAAAPLIAEAYAREYGMPLPASILNVFPLADRPATFRTGNPQAPLTLYWFSQTIGARRGLEEILRGMAAAGTSNIQLHLRGHWQSGYEKTLGDLAASLALESSQLVFHELAPPDDMIRLSAEYDVGLALEPGRSENNDIALSNKICTYLLAGNAVIATATRGQRQFMNEISGAGLGYEIGDVSALAAQLRAWERDRSALEAARRRAWQLGGERFNWNVEQQKLIQVVAEVLNQNA